MAGGGFTVILSVKGTDRERRRMAESILSAVRLGPPEIVFGVDAGRPGLEAEIAAVCEGAGYRSYRIVAVPESPAWRFQLAHVCWHGLRAASNDACLFYDVDSALRPEVMLGLAEIRAGAALASLTLRPRLRTPADLLRFATYRVWVARRPVVFACPYWVSRAELLGHLRRRDYASISNGVDSLALRALTRAGRRVVTLKAMGASCFCLQQGDIPWKQFQYGIWRRAEAGRRLRAHEERWRAAGARAGPRRLYRRARAACGVALYAATHLRPHALAGYLWAGRNRGHPAVLGAEGRDYTEYASSGGSLIRGLRDWGETGTGF